MSDLKTLADLRDEICTKNKYLHNGCCHVAQTIFCVISDVLVNFTAIMTRCSMASQTFGEKM